MYNECFLHMSKTLTERYFFLSHVSNGTGKNDFVSQYTCLKASFLRQIKDIKINNYCVLHTHISNRKDHVQHFN